MRARFPFAQIGAAGVSPNLRQFGTIPAPVSRTEEQSSYFFRNIAAGKKIISLGRISSPRSTAHGDFLDLTGGYDANPGAHAAVLIGQLGGRRGGDLHRPCGRGHLPARSVVTCDVHCTHLRRTPALPAAPLY